MSALLPYVVIFTAAAAQDVSFTTKMALVAHGRRGLAVVADLANMVIFALYMVVTAAVSLQHGVSWATAAAFVCLAIGGGLGTYLGMTLDRFLEARIDRRPAAHLAR